MDPSEREKYQAAIHGDREAFEMIIRTHSRTLFAIAYGILQSPEEAEDIVQDSLVKAWKARWRVRAARHTRPCSGPNAQTTSPCSRFNRLNVWQRSTTKLTTGWSPICTASFRTANGTRFMRISSIAVRAERLIRKSKL